MKTLFDDSVRYACMRGAVYKFDGKDIFYRGLGGVWYRIMRYTDCEWNSMIAAHQAKEEYDENAV